MPWNNNTITIRVMAEEKDILRKKRYRYQIVGLNDQYIESYQPELVIRSLQPGDLSDYGIVQHQRWRLDSRRTSLNNPCIAAVVSIMVVHSGMYPADIVYHHSNLLIDTETEKKRK